MGSLAVAGCVDWEMPAACEAADMAKNQAPTITARIASTATVRDTLMLGHHDGVVALVTAQDTEIEDSRAASNHFLNKADDALVGGKRQTITGDSLYQCCAGL